MLGDDTRRDSREAGDNVAVIPPAAVAAAMTEGNTSANVTS